MKKILLVLLAVVVLIGGTLMGSYNGLVSANEQVTGQWSQVENQLQRRNDLMTATTTFTTSQTMTEIPAFFSPVRPAFSAASCWQIS